MPRHYRHLSLAVLLALAIAALPAPRPAQAQNAIVVTTLQDQNDGCATNGCSLRDAINAANSDGVTTTITFGVTGEIVPLSELPELTEDGTTINGGTAPSVILNGSSAGEANGITIRSSNNVIRGLVIYNFTGTINTTAGAGIYINGAPAGALPARGDGNQIYGNWIGVNGSGSAAISNRGYGIFLTNGASSNIIGADSDADRNVIAGNLSGGIRLENRVSLHGTLSGNSIVGNWIGTNTAGNDIAPGANVQDADAGIGVSAGSRNTVIRANVIGGFNSTLSGSVAAGINLPGVGTAPNNGQEPRGTLITGNYIGVTKAGIRIANRIGVRVGFNGYGPYSTTIGDASSAAGRNVIAGNSYRGIDLADAGFFWGDITIAGNYIGLDGSGAPQPNGWTKTGEYGYGIYIGRPLASQPITPGKATIGPGNVISANTSYGIVARSDGHVIKGNYLGTTTAGTSATTATANTSGDILLNNGTGVTVGGPSPADRNIMAFNGVTVSPGSVASYVTSGHTIEGNYIGVSADGVTPLNGSRDQLLGTIGIFLNTTSGNVIRNNVIGGLQFGIQLGLNATGTEANGNTISGNKIGAPASGELVFAASPSDADLAGKAPRNLADGIRITRGTGNTISGNLISYNNADNSNYAGIRVGTSVTTGAAASNNLIEDNRLVRNGAFDGYGVWVDTATGVRITRNTTQFNPGGIFTTDRGISFTNNGNNSRAAPTGLAIASGPPLALTGAASGCSGCTVEVFGTTLSSESNEGPVYLASGTTDGGGNFSVPLATCLRYLTATVTDGAGNTSLFSSRLDTGNPGPCAPVTFSLSQSPITSNDILPGTTATYTHTISHNSPIALTYTVVFTSSQKWASAPALVTVPANGSASFVVSVSVPPGTSTTPPVLVDTTDVQVFLGAVGSNVVRDTTRPQAIAVTPAQPLVSGPLTQGRAGATVIFNHVVTNTGSVSGTFLISKPTLSGAPGDWSAADPSPASLTLNGGASGNVSLQINTPSLPSPTAPVTVTFQVSVQGASPPRVVTQTDYITVPTLRGLSFTPRSSETITTPAGASVSFTYSLTNTGNIADSFIVTPTAPAPLTVAVSSTPPLANLPAGATAAVTVTYSVPPGTTQGTYPATITAQATGGTSPPALPPRDVTVVVTGGAAITLAPNPPLPGPVTPGPGGAVVTFTNTLTNTGNATGTLQFNPITGLPTGWGATILNNTCPITPAGLGPGAKCAFDVEVTVPEGAPGGPVPVGLSVTAFNTPPTPNVTATAVNTVTVSVVRGLELAPSGLTANVGPGQVYTFTHTLTNTGNAADSFDLAVAQSPGGWTVAVSPTVVSGLAPGAPRTVQVSATPGPGVSGGVANTITLTATGQGGGPSASVTDTVTLASVLGGDLSFGRQSNVQPGQTAAYTFTVRNTGTVPLSYTVALTNSLAGWSATSSGTPTPVIAPGLTTTLYVNVTAPPDAAPRDTNTTLVRLLAGDGSGATLDTATALTRIGPRLGVRLDPKGVPAEGLPNSTVPLSFTVTNLGSEAATFVLTTTESLGWLVSLSSPSVTLGPGDAIPVTAYVTIKPSATAGARNFVKVEVALDRDATVRDESTNEVSVPLVVDVGLSSSQVRGVRIGATTNLDSLTIFNAGSAYDFFNLRVAGALPAGWSVLFGQIVVGLNTGDVARVSLKVRVDAAVAHNTTQAITLEASSATNNQVVARVTLNLTAISDTPPAPPRTKTYLPLIARQE